MRWDDFRRSENVEDDRGGGGFGGGGGGIGLPGGGLGIGTIIILGLVGWALGIDPRLLIGGAEILQGGQQQYQQPAQPRASRNTPPNDQMGQFVAAVLGDTEDTWNQIFAEGGATYRKPKLVIYSGSLPTPCAFAQSAMGPFYCPLDQKVYLDTSFFRDMQTRYRACSGDKACEFSEAYVIAHEVGHHVQNLTGILPKFNQMRQQMGEAQANQMSTRVELQADCFAGIWGHFTAQKGLLEQGDLEEALNAAQQIGDDTLQRKTQGYVVPESFNHGTSAQRVTWFKRGFQSGKLADCDTFNNPV
jgi:predicted metalloprotease